MNNYTEEELKFLLCLYYFDNSRITDKLLSEFCDSFSKTFKKNINKQNILYSISIFKNVDPYFHNSEEKNNEYIDYYNIWEEYINKEKIKELRLMYRLFKKGLYIKEQDDEIKEECTYDFNDNLPNLIASNDILYVADCPKELYDTHLSIEEINKRSAKVKFNAIKLANYCCEYDCNHKLFERKSVPISYTEGHHLIPLKYQYLFKNNLDVEANVVSLCCECHRKIHYGKEGVDLLVNLYENRKERLSNSGINIEIDKLIEMYK